MSDWEKRRDEVYERRERRQRRVWFALWLVAAVLVVLYHNLP
jgi:predicted nucleic acid-binding Zn ribbon protein